ncbi:MAG TPA: hypothetical protein VMW52_02775, partial [Phycisphaerae bacterium]|nr:hypothetical protein [Phycisphaerae bacterium]
MSGTPEAKRDTGQPTEPPKQPPKGTAKPMAEIAAEAMPRQKPLGAILLEMGKVRKEQLAEALEIRKKRGGAIGA